MDPDRISTVAKLQCDLMKQGWHMLKKGGTMVYSTCSLSIRQNEENVAWFLIEFKDATLASIPNYDINKATIKKQANAELQKVIDENCLRFDPIQSRTSGFFLAKFIKE